MSKHTRTTTAASGIVQPNMAPTARLQVLVRHALAGRPGNEAVDGTPSVTETSQTPAKAVAVLGAGIAALSTAAALVRSGKRVKVLAPVGPLDESVCSQGACGLWYPAGGEPSRRSARWAARTLEVLLQECSNESSACGRAVSITHFVKAFVNPRAPPLPAWSAHPALGACSWEKQLNGRVVAATTARRPAQPGKTSKPIGDGRSTKRKPSPSASPSKGASPTQTQPHSSVVMSVTMGRLAETVAVGEDLESQTQRRSPRRSVPATPAIQITGVDVSRAPVDKPSIPVPGAADAVPPSLPMGCHSGWSFDLPLCDPPRYLVALLEELSASPLAEVLIDPKHHFSNMDAAAARAKDLGCGAIVNCTGLAGAMLAGDDRSSMVAEKGVVCTLRRPLSVKAAPASSLLVEDSPVASKEYPLFVVPQPSGIIMVGGSRQEELPGMESSASWQAEDVSLILDHAAAAAPDVVDARPIRRWTGWRPVRRAGVRLEASRHKCLGMPVVHNYGHGGQGWSTFWGCAEEVVDLISCASA